MYLYLLHVVEITKNPSHNTCTDAINTYRFWNVVGAFSVTIYGSKIDDFSQKNHEGLFHKIQGENVDKGL